MIRQKRKLASNNLIQQVNTNSIYFKIQEPIDEYVFTKISDNCDFSNYAPKLDYNIVFIAYNNIESLVNDIYKYINSNKLHAHIIVLDCNDTACLPSSILKNFIVINNLKFKLIKNYKLSSIEDKIKLSYMYCTKNLFKYKKSYLYSFVNMNVNIDNTKLSKNTFILNKNKIPAQINKMSYDKKFEYMMNIIYGITNFEELGSEIIDDEIKQLYNELPKEAKESVYKQYIQLIDQIKNRL